MIPKNQKGSILITVILLAALISIIAVRIYGSLTLETRRSVNIIDSDRAYYYALGAEELALQILKQSFEKPKEADKDKVHLGQSWAQKGIIFPIDGGQLAGEIQDMSACFNLNSLLAKPRKSKVRKSPRKGNSNIDVNQAEDVNEADKPLQGQVLLEALFTHLLEKQSDQYESVSPQALASQVRDWLDSDEQTFINDGAEDNEYLLQDYPYRSGNTLMGSVEELRTLKDFTPRLVELFAPYLCALPDAEMSSINVNTIESSQPELLMMFYSNLSMDDAREVLESRPAEGYDQSSFKDKLEKGTKLRTEATGLIQFDSNRFLINAEAIVGRGRSRLQSLVLRKNKKKFKVIARRFASDFGLRSKTSKQSKQSKK